MQLRQMSSNDGKRSPYTLARALLADVATTMHAWIMSVHALQSHLNLNLSPGIALIATCNIAHVSESQMSVIHGGRTPRANAIAFPVVRHVTTNDHPHLISSGLGPSSADPPG